MKSDWSFSCKVTQTFSITNNHYPANSNIPEAQYDPLCKVASHKPPAEQQKDTEVEDVAIAVQQVE